MKIFTFIVCGLVAFSGVLAQAQDSNSQNQEQDKVSESKTDVAPALDFKATTIDGKEVDLSQYAGKVVVIVNVASRCGMTPQYKDLQAMHEELAQQGVAILGFPCNQFGKQEPGSEDEIKAFCSKNYGVTFDMFAKVDVNGDDAHELFKHLTALDVGPVGKGSVKWNFEKFILDREGKLVGRFGSRVKPSSDEFKQAIKEAMGG